jgi:hypothetical protein
MSFTTADTSVRSWNNSRAFYSLYDACEYGTEYPKTGATARKP